MNIINNQEYQNNVKNVNTYKKEYEVKHYNNFYFHTLDTFYVISYHSSYKAACKSKTYKTYKSAVSAWAEIVATDGNPVKW